MFDLELGGGFFDAVATDSGRKLAIGSGVAADPKISISDAGTMISVKTSTGRLMTTDGPDKGGEPVELVYWRQRF